MIQRNFSNLVLAQSNLLVIRLDGVRNNLRPNRYRGNYFEKMREGNKGTGRWSKEEHRKFIGALKFYGKCWKKIEFYIGTPTANQIRSDAKNIFNKTNKIKKKNL